MSSKTQKKTNEKVSLVFQSFTSKNEYFRAVFSIWSFFVHSSIDKENCRVFLFTDNPEFFEDYLKPLPIVYVFLSGEKQRELRGEIDFFHRIKIGIIREALEATKQKILYCDSDTFFISDPAWIFDQVSKDQVVMHCLEYNFRERMTRKSPPAMEKFLQFISETTFRFGKDREFCVDINDCSWNAGVMAFDPEHLPLFNQVYNLTDLFYKGSASHASEQFAFSIVMQNNAQLVPCEKSVYHYWYRIKKTIADEIFAGFFNDQWETADENFKLESVSRLCDNLNDLLDHHIYMIRDNAIQAFNLNKFYQAYGYTLKALLKDPFDFLFIRDVLYHSRRYFTGKQ